MKKEKIYSLYHIIELFILGAVALTKFVYIYKILLPQEYAIIFAITTLSIIGVIYHAISRFSKKCATIFSLVFYALTSFMLLIDCTYFSYNYKFTSIKDLALVGNLFAVKDSISEINPARFFWILLDIPFLLIYLIFRKRIQNYFEKNHPRSLRIKTSLSVSIFGIIIVGIVSYGAFTNFKLRYLKSENIIYHTLDIFNCFFQKNDEFDYSKYTYPRTSTKDENFGIASGKNVIIIQVEALQSFPIDKTYDGQEITPFLNSLKKNNSFYFNNYFYQVGAGNTSDAEFAVNNSLLPSSSDASYEAYYNNTYHGLPYILKENGYTSANAFHAFNGDFWNRDVAYVNQGFDNYYSSKDYEHTETIGMGLSDDEFLSQVADKMKDIEKPFYSFVITLSSHHPFQLPKEKQNIILRNEHQDTLFGNYINAINYVDNSLENFFNKLKELDLYDDSIFVIYGDHFGIANYNKESAEYASELIGHDFNVEDMFHVPLLIHIPSMKASHEINTVGGHIDVLPTLLHLLGVETSNSIMMGTDLLSVKDNIVYEQTHVGRGSFITNDIFYYSSSSGIDLYNKAYELGTGREVPITQEILEFSKEAIQKLKDAETILKRNLIVY